MAQRRLSLSRSSSFSSPNLSAGGGLRAGPGRRIDCGLRSVVAARYSRDYIVLPSGRDSEARRPSPSPSPVEWREGGSSADERAGEQGSRCRYSGDSGVGSSSERTSVAAVSVTEEIRRCRRAPQPHNSPYNI